MNRLNLESDYTGFVNADIVVEAVFEDLELKKTVFVSLKKLFLIIVLSGQILAR